MRKAYVTLPECVGEQHLLWLHPHIDQCRRRSTYGTDETTRHACTLSETWSVKIVDEVKRNIRGGAKKSTRQQDKHQLRDDRDRPIIPVRDCRQPSAALRRIHARHAMTAKCHYAAVIDVTNRSKF